MFRHSVWRDGFYVPLVMLTAEGYGHQASLERFTLLITPLPHHPIRT